MVRQTNLHKYTTALTDLITSSTGDSISLAGADGYSVQVVVDENTDAAKTVDSGDYKVETLTFPAKAGATDGDYVYFDDASGARWAIALDTTGGAAATPSGAIWTAIAAANKDYVDINAATDAASVAALVETAMNALTGFSAAFTTDDTAADGTMELARDAKGVVATSAGKTFDDAGAGSITAAEDTAGAATEVNTADDELTIPSHGLPTGMKGQFTTTGTLPAGLSLATDYFVIAVDENTIQVATTLANAQAGTQVDITDEGADGSVNTFTPTALAGASVVVQKSNDGSNWTNIASATSITVDGSYWPAEVVDPQYQFIRLVYAITAGSMSATSYTYVKSK